MERMTSYLKPAPRRAPAWWLVFGILLGFSTWGATNLYRQYQVVLAQKEELFKLQRATRVSLPPKKTSRADQEIEGHWIALQQELNFSWYSIFAALEGANSPDIAILEFLPDKMTSLLTLRGNARNLEALTTYLDLLSEEPAFHEVYLSHQKKIQQTGLSILSFEIRLRLRN